MTAPLSPALARASLARASLGTADAQVARVLELVGVHAHALNALLTVSTVEWSDATATACVECIDRPRLLLNPAFVAQWCHTPERLATLILHELLHIALGHTRLFPRPTLAHNVAFDAIINRTLLSAIEGTRMRHSSVCFGYDVERYTDLFTDFYSASKAPEFILRPPPGWPLAPDWTASCDMPASLREIHRDLYDVTRFSSVSRGKWEPPAPRYTQVTYADIIAALRDCDEFQAPDVPLLGAHGDTAADRDAIRGSRDRDAAELLAGALEPLCGQLPGRGEHLGLTQAADASRTPALEQALRVLLRKAIKPNGVARTRASWRQRDVRVVHRMHDRRAACRVRAAELLGTPMPMLFDGHVYERAREPQQVAIYVDVSGSMSQVLPHLRRALMTLRREIDPTLYWFSTVVVPAKGDELERGNMPSTGGTSICAVITHATQQLPVGSAAIVLTDGHLESVPAATSAALRSAHVALHVGVVGGGPLHTGAAWLKSTTPLPSPGF
jgi:hypothetical protein